MTRRVRRWATTLVLAAGMVAGGAREAFAECWQQSDGVYCQTCGQIYCCLTYYANGCCTITWQDCWEI